MSCKSTSTKKKNKVTKTILQLPKRNSIKNTCNLQATRRERIGRRKGKSIKHRKTKKRKGAKKMKLNPRLIMKSVEGMETAALIIGGRRSTINKTGGKGTPAQQNSVIGHQQALTPIRYLDRRAPP